MAQHIAPMNVIEALMPEEGVGPFLERVLPLTTLSAVEVYKGLHEASSRKAESLRKRLDAMMLGVSRKRDMVRGLNKLPPVGVGLEGEDLASVWMPPPTIERKQVITVEEADERCEILYVMLEEVQEENDNLRRRLKEEEQMTQDAQKATREAVRRAEEYRQRMERAEVDRWEREARIQYLEKALNAMKL